jgi:hypothetical protein
MGVIYLCINLNAFVYIYIYIYIFIYPTHICIHKYIYSPRGAKESCIRRCISLGVPFCLLFPMATVGQTGTSKLIYDNVSNMNIVGI